MKPWASSRGPETGVGDINRDFPQADFWPGVTSGLLVTREQRGGVELVRSSNECIGDFESTEEAFCCPDFRVTTWALCIDPPFAKLIRG